MNKKLKNNGITLISLVITIIVMLILVGVSITLAVNGGLFNYAGNAVGDTENAMKNEKNLIDEIIDYYVKPNTGEKVHNWTRVGDAFTCSHCNKTYTMGQEVEYTAKGETSTTISAQMSGLDKYKEKKLSYPEGDNIDADGTQRIEVQEDVKWVVLGIDKETESLLITTSESVYASGENILWFYGAAAYNNGPSEVNRICKELYSNSEYGYARGMTIEDVNEVFNFTPLGGVYGVLNTDNTYTYKTTGNYTTKLIEIKEESIEEKIEKAGYYTPDGTAFEDLTLDGYRYYLSEDGKSIMNLVEEEGTLVTSAEKNIIFSGEKSYWLATRACSINVMYVDAWVNFGMGNVSVEAKYVRSWGANFSNGDQDFNEDFSCNFRPVVNCVGKLPTVKE